MAQRYYRPNRQPRRGNEYEEDWQSPSSGSSSSGESNRILDDIDAVLAESESARNSTQETLKKDVALSDEQKELDEAVGESSASEPEKEDDFSYSPDGGRRRKVLGRFTRRQAATGGIVGLIIGAFTLFSALFGPILKLESFLTGINQRAFGYASQAIESAVERHVGKYMFYQLLRMDECGSTISINCRSNYTNSLNPATRLYRTWQDARVESKLLDRFGFQVETNRRAGPGEPTHILRDARGYELRLSSDGIMRGRNANESRILGREIRQYIRNETRWHEVMQRRSVRKYLSRKHGVNSWCWFACRSRDNLDRRVYDTKTRFKMKFIEKFVYPFSGKYGFILECITSGQRCQSEEMRQRGLTRGNLPSEEVDRLTKELVDVDVGTRSFTRFASHTILRSLLEKQLVRRAVNLIPLVGQIYFALQMADMYDRMDQFVDNNGFSKLSAELNASQYLEFYTTMRTANDEMKTHNMSLEDVGEIMTIFDGAEQSLVYQTRNGVGGRVQAASDYLCDDGKPIPEGEKVCNEKLVGGRVYSIEKLWDHPVVGTLRYLTNQFDNCITVIEIFDRCPLRVRSVLRPIVEGADWVVDNTAGAVVGFISGLATRAIPGLDNIVQTVSDKFNDIMGFIMEELFGLPVQFGDPGREMYDGLEAGGEYAAYEFCKGGKDGSTTYGLGCRRLSEQEAASVMGEYYAKLDEEFRNDSLINRIASLDSPRSLASRFVAMMPVSLHQFSLSNFNIFTGFASALQNILQRPVTAADGEFIKSPFNIPLYGYTAADLASYDPEELTDEYCRLSAVRREESKTEDPLTGFEEYTVFDPCMLEAEVIDVAGALFES